MKHPVTRLLFIMLLFTPSFLAAEGNVDSSEKPLIMVTIPPQKYILEQLAGDLAEVESLLSPVDNPHSFQPLPSQIRQMSRADIYITVGVGLESSFLPQLKSAVPSLKVVESATAVHLRNIDAGHLHEEEAEEHETLSTDPHYWMSPARVAESLPPIVEALIEVYPQNQEELRGNALAFQTRLEQLDRELSHTLKESTGQILFIYHPSLGYFADTYGLRQEAIETGGKEPSPRQMEALIQEAREDGVKLLLVQPQFNKRSAEFIAAALDGRVESVNHLAYDWEENLKQLAQWIKDSNR